MRHHRRNRHHTHTLIFPVLRLDFLEAIFCGFQQQPPIPQQSARSNSGHCSGCCRPACLRANKSSPPSSKARGTCDRGSFDHLVGAGEDGPGKCNAQRTRRLEIDDQLNLYDLFNRQIGGLGTIEDLSSVNAD